MSDAAERIRAEADIASRPGQHDRLNQIADEVAQLSQRISLALEASYWDRPYDTRMDAIRAALHGEEEA